MNLSIALIILLFSTDCYAKYRIINGKNAKLGMFPYVGLVEIETEDKLVRCSCSLIDAHTVLTAAHCIKTEEKKLTVRFGLLTTQIKSVHEQKRKIKAAYIFPGYKNSHSKCMKLIYKSIDLLLLCLFFCVNDVAVLKVTKPFVVNQYVQPIELAQPSAYIGQKVLMMGFGSNLTDDSKILRYGFNRVFIEKGLYFCTKESLNSASIFSGDSGGPIVMEKGDRLVQIGVNIMGVDEGRYFENNPQLSSCRAIVEAATSRFSDINLKKRESEPEINTVPDYGCFYKVNEKMDWAAFDNM